MAAIFLVVRLVPPLAFSPVFFQGWAAPPTPSGINILGWHDLTTPTLMQFYLSGVTVAVLDWWSALGAWCRGITITGVG